MTNHQRIIFIGPLGGGRVPTNGASVKNYYIVQRLKDCVRFLTVVDTERWKQNPLILLKLLLVILVNRNAKYILSLNSMSAYRLLKFMSILSGNREIYYWIIGGSIALWLKDGKVSKNPYRCVYRFLAEGKSMVEMLGCMGFKNAIYVPNFKKISYIPVKNNENAIVRFLFLSRINPHKGCDYILSVTEKLNQRYSGLFEVDFYGEVASDYSTFTERIDRLENVNYNGFIDLRDCKNYDKISSYDAMLFPTYWHGEGFPGVLIDAFIAGIPVIASDWHLNSDIISNGENGFLINAQDEDALYDIMEKCIQNPCILRKMSIACQEQAKNYDCDNVLTVDFLKSLGLIC